MPGKKYLCVGGCGGNEEKLGFTLVEGTCEGEGYVSCHGETLAFRSFLVFFDIFLWKWTGVDRTMVKWIME